MSNLFSLRSSSNLYNTLADYQKRIFDVIHSLENFKTELDRLDVINKLDDVHPQQAKKFLNIISDVSRRIRILEDGMSRVETVPNQIKQLRCHQWTLHMVITKLLTYVREPLDKINQCSSEIPNTCSELLSHAIAKNKPESEYADNEYNQDLIDALQNLQLSDQNHERKEPRLELSQEPNTTINISSDENDKKLKELHSLDSLGLSKETLELLNEIPGFTSV